MDPIFFASPEEFRDWLDRHHATEREVHVGYWKKHTGRASLTWARSVDEALCYGWIDGIRRSIDADRYTNRFTPRRPTSNWSAVNIERVGELTAEGRMRPAGLAAFERRTEAKSGIYSYENRPAAFDAAIERAFRKQRKAWAFWEAQPPGYRRLMVFHVMSAKREETRARRVSALVDASARGERLGQMTGAAKAPNAKSPKRKGRPRVARPMSTRSDRASVSPVSRTVRPAPPRAQSLSTESPARTGREP